MAHVRPDHRADHTEDQAEKPGQNSRKHKGDQQHDDHHLRNLLQNQLLDDLELNIDELFPFGSFGFLIGKVLNVTLNTLFLFDTSILNIANKIVPLLKVFGVVDEDSLMGIVEHLMDEYITASLLEGIGHSLANIVRDFVFDYNFADDMNATIVYDGKVDVEATRENYRLPTAVTVTLGEDSTSRNISWYTKSTVMGSDIEILEYAETPSFSGSDIVPDGVTVTADAERTIRTYPGIDFGIFGIMQYEFPMNRHTVTVSGLEEGKKYVYRHPGDGTEEIISRKREKMALELAKSIEVDPTFIYMDDEEGAYNYAAKNNQMVIDKLNELLLTK